MRRKVVGGLADKICYYAVLLVCMVLFAISLVGITGNLEVTKISESLKNKLDAPKELVLCVPTDIFAGEDPIVEFTFNTSATFDLEEGEATWDLLPYIVSNTSSGLETADQAPILFQILSSEDIRVTGLTTKTIRDDEDDTVESGCVTALFEGSFTSRDSFIVVGLLIGGGIEYETQVTDELSLPLSMEVEVLLKGREEHDFYFIPVSQSSFGSILKLDFSEEVTSDHGDKSTEWRAFGLRMDARPNTVDRVHSMGEGNLQCNSSTVNCQFAAFISPVSMISKSIVVRNLNWDELLALVGGAWAAAFLIMKIFFADVTPTENEEPKPVFYQSRLRVSAKDNAEVVKSSSQLANIG